MRLNYHMKGFEPVPEIDIDLEDPNQIHWLHAIVAENPEVIFFFTIATTDIWDEEPEMDYNTIVTMGEDMVLSHTYAPRCPEGCYGQLDECKFKPENLEPVCSCPGAPYHKDDCPLSKNYKE